jgi:antirestriction protein ArdC
MQRQGVASLGCAPERRPLSSGIKVHWGHPQPAYFPVPDRVVMPNYDDFHSVDDFVSTLGHQHSHLAIEPRRRPSVPQLLLLLL